jgi:hypothetical protein
VATHLRVDLFNYAKPRDPADTQAQIDVAYIGLCDDYSEIDFGDESVIFFDGTTNTQ